MREGGVRFDARGSSFWDFVDARRMLWRGRWWPGRAVVVGIVACCVPISETSEEVSSGRRVHNIAQISLDMLASTCWSSPEPACDAFDRCNTTCSRMVVHEAGWHARNDDIFYNVSATAECGVVSMLTRVRYWTQTLRLLSATLNGVNVGLDDWRSIAAPASPGPSQK